jgi:hypothetical protein
MVITRAGEPEGGWPVPDAGCGQIYERSSSKPSRCSRRFFLDTKRLATIGIVARKTLNTQRLWGFWTPGLRCGRLPACLLYPVHGINTS